MPLAAASFAACGAAPDLIASKMLFEMADLPIVLGARKLKLSGACDDVKVTTGQNAIQLLISECGL